MKGWQVAFAAFVVGALVGVGLMARATVGAIGDRDAARVTLAGLAARDSALLEDAKLLRQRADAAEKRRVAEVAAARGAIAKVEVDLTRALALAEANGKKPTDTVWVTVAMIANADTAIRACSDALNSCELSIAAEKAEHTNTRQMLATRTGERDKALTLIPTPAQQRWHDAKLVGITSAVLVTLKMIIGTIVQ